MCVSSANILEGLRHLQLHRLVARLVVNRLESRSRLLVWVQPSQHLTPDETLAMQHLCHATVAERWYRLGIDCVIVANSQIWERFPSDRTQVVMSWNKQQWFRANVSPTSAPIWPCLPTDYPRGTFRSCRCSSSFRDAFWASARDVAMTWPFDRC